MVGFGLLVEGRIGRLRAGSCLSWRRIGWGIAGCRYSWMLTLQVEGRGLGPSERGRCSAAVRRAGALVADEDCVLEALLARADGRNEAECCRRDLPRYVDVACRAEHGRAHTQREDFDPVLS